MGTSNSGYGKFARSQGKDRDHRHRFHFCSRVTCGLGCRDRLSLCRDPPPKRCTALRKPLLCPHPPNHQPKQRRQKRQRKSGALHRLLLRWCTQCLLIQLRTLLRSLHRLGPNWHDGPPVHLRNHWRRTDCHHHEKNTKTQSHYCLRSSVGRFDPLGHLPARFYNHLRKTSLGLYLPPPHLLPPLQMGESFHSILNSS